MASPPVSLKTRTAVEDEIRRRVDAERARLLKAAARRPPVAHFRRPLERPFLPDDRERVTVLFGGLTWKHEALVKAVFESAGLNVETLPPPDVAAFQLGKEYGNNGQCNPTYFTVGHLIKYLQGLERQGRSREEIVERYVFVTAGSCGPCRFGMYEAEYRLAVENAGFTGFRILIIQQNRGVDADASVLGLDTTFRLAAVRAISVGDVLHDLTFQVRPYEVNPGETDRAFTDVTRELAAILREAAPFDLVRRAPAWIARRLDRRPGLRDVLDTLGTICHQLYDPRLSDALRAARETIDRIEVDRLRTKPVVKITGEFFAQTTEGDGNFRMFSFLEREGAEVLPESITNWVMYLLWQARERQGGAVPSPRTPQSRLGARLTFRTHAALLRLAQRIYAHQYHRLVRELGGIGHRLLDMDELAGLAGAYYNTLAQGGEGHLEVAKNIYYTVRKKAHMVLSLKPFGCMPSTQSDGVQSAVMSHFKDMIFLPIETSGEGEVNAHSRVQMALGEAKAKARAEFQQALESTGRRLEDVRGFVDAHRELRHPFYRVPHRHGVIGTAARFVLHVSDVMDGKAKLRRSL